MKKSLTISGQWNADIIHFMYMEWNELPFLLADILENSKSSLAFGTLVVPYFFQSRTSVGALKRAYYSINNKILRYLIKSGRLDGLFTLSDITTNKLSKRWGSIDAKKITTIPDPVEDFDSESKLASRKLLDLPRKKHILLFFGGLKSWKGPRVLLEAMSGLETSDVALVLAGKPVHVDEEEIDRYREKVPDNIEIIKRLGFVPKQDVGHYFVSSDIVVTPYRSSYKGTSGILQNATGARRPVVTTNAGQLGRIVRKHTLGTVVPPEKPTRLARAIDSLLNDADRLKEFREHAHIYAEKHNWQKMSSIIREEYRKRLFRKVS